MKCSEEEGMQVKYRILLLEDDISLIDGLVYSLEKNGFDLDVAQTVSEAYRNLDAKTYDLLLLDVSLPDGTGFGVCDQIRGRGSQVPVIFLTALDEEVNIIRGLDGGGDDYITKPFKLGELCSRIRALLRRSAERSPEAVQASHAADTGMLSSGTVMVEPCSGRAFLDGQPLELTSSEYRLLCLLIKNAGNTLSRNAILDMLWDGNGSFVDDNTLSVYMRRLREKIEADPSKPEHLLTVRGFGYQWKA